MKDEKTPALQGGWHVQNPQKLGLAYLHKVSSHQHPVSQPGLPACLATRVACTWQHGTRHILHSSPLLLPVALSAHVLPSPRKPSASLTPNPSTCSDTNLASFVFSEPLQHIVNASFLTGVPLAVSSLKAGTGPSSSSLP